MASGLKIAIITATQTGNTNGEKRYHQRLALYQMIPISAARHTGISHPTKNTKAKITDVVRKIRIHGVNHRRKRERKIISIITFDPLTTIICIRPDALRFSLSSVSRLVFCHRIIPHKISCHCGGKISDNLRSNQDLIRTKYEYSFGGILST